MHYPPKRTRLRISRSSFDPDFQAFDNEAVDLSFSLAIAPEKINGILQGLEVSLQNAGKPHDFYKFCFNCIVDPLLQQAGPGVLSRKLGVGCRFADISVIEMHDPTLHQLQTPPLPARDHRSRGLAVRPFQSEPARGRGDDAETWHRCFLRNGPPLDPQVRIADCAQLTPPTGPPRRCLASG
ncbi:hypothetical protein EDD52_108137 [Primorskyibacter sedentarius]|uniref:Uncharacterized protein n=1 Tax=Primorskyibacter sedentarius TaxID=745311 RepID=A0A4R3JB00_9RHOB|nr:hypothetical protein EDD52_108137 [Primorskyibacter sedentarius]